MNKLNEKLTLVANLAVVTGVFFLVAELRQNTRAIEAQTRDSMTEKQMMFAEWIATNPATADVYVRAGADPDALSPIERAMYSLLVQGNWREWENSLYQFEHGLFTEEEFLPRVNVWRALMQNPGYRSLWVDLRDRYSPNFRQQIDQILADSAN